MLPTPTFTHLTKNDYNYVYEPSEDTFLFIDALEKEIDYLKALKPLIALEIGSGSGLVITFLAKYLNQNTTNLTQFYAIDVNKHACLATQRTSNENGVCVNVVNCDLLTPLQDRLRHNVDILLFNPPYVLSESCEVGKRDITAAWAGGVNGREVMERVFPLINDLLADNGVFYLVCIKPNQIEVIQNELSNYGFHVSVVLNRKTSIENLFVLKITRKSN